MDHVEVAALLIRLGVGIVMVSFGLYQVTKPETWLKYIPKPLQFIMPFKPTSFMRIHALGNIGLGLLLAIGIWQPVSVWLALLWWAWVLPFAFYAELTMGLRDFAIIMALIALLLLV
jgi:hypothetical protein